MSEIISDSFLGLSVSIFTSEELFNYFYEVLESREPHIFYGYSIGLLPLLKKHPKLIDYCNKYDLMVTDGRIFYLLAKFYGIPVKHDISIPNMVIKLLQIANEKKYSVMLFGANEKNNRHATNNIRKKYPQALIIDGISGYYENEDETQIINYISSKRPDILLVGTNTPHKEIFSTNMKNKLNTKIIIPCGGMIDVLSGEKHLTPLWLKKMGFAWLYRLIQQPFERLVITTQFCFMFFKIVPYLIFKKIKLIKTEKNILDFL